MTRRFWYPSPHIIKDKMTCCLIEHPELLYLTNMAPAQATIISADVASFVVASAAVTYAAKISACLWVRALKIDPT